MTPLPILHVPFTGSNYNPYAKVINDVYSGAYGFPFSDRYRHVLADLGRSSSGGIDGVTVTLLDDTTSPQKFVYQGNWNPQSGVTTFNLNINAGASNTDFPNTPFTFNTKSYPGGNGYDWPTTVNNYGFPPPTTTASINKIPAAEGLNIYNLDFGARHFLVLVKVSGKQVQWCAIAGGASSTWTSPVLYIGSVMD